MRGKPCFIASYRVLASVLQHLDELDIPANDSQAAPPMIACNLVSTEQLHASVPFGDNIVADAA